MTHVVHLTDTERVFADDKDPLFGSGTEQVLAAPRADGWSVIDTATDWSAICSSEPTTESPTPGEPS